MTGSSHPLYTVTLSLPAGLNEDQASRFAECLSEWAVSTSLLRKGDPFHGDWQLQWLMEDAPDAAALTQLLAPLAEAENLPVPTLLIALLPDINWLEHSYRQFPPFSVGRFFIHGSHCTDVTPPGQIDLEIEAATAFGSGEHGTTSGCLLLLERLQDSGFLPGKILDMGCGSGILSIAAVKLWNRDVLAVDIDPESVLVTNRHRDANGIGPVLTARAGDGFAVVDGSYDLIIANILPQPLKAMADDLMNHLAPGGHAILSGLLLDQAQGVLDVYTARGAVLHTRLDRGEWAALLIGKPA